MVGVLSRRSDVGIRSVCRLFRGGWEGEFFILVWFVVFSGFFFGWWEYLLFVFFF